MGESFDEAGDGRTRGDDVAREHDHRHLPGESRQIPEAAAERLGDDLWRRPVDEGRSPDDDHADEGEDLGVGEPLLRPAGQSLREPGQP